MPSVPEGELLLEFGWAGYQVQEGGSEEDPTWSAGADLKFVDGLPVVSPRPG